MGEEKKSRTHEADQNRWDTTKMRMMKDLSSPCPVTNNLQRQFFMVNNENNEMNNPTAPLTVALSLMILLFSKLVFSYGFFFFPLFYIIMLHSSAFPVFLISSCILEALYLNSYPLSCSSKVYNRLESGL